LSVDKPTAIQKKRCCSHRGKRNTFKPDKDYPKSERELFPNEVRSKFTRYTTFEKLFGKTWKIAMTKMEIRRNKHIQMEIARKAEELKNKLAYLKSLEFDITNDKYKINDYNKDLEEFRIDFSKEKL